MALSTVEDQIALRHLASIYCSIVDDGDGPRMAGLFVPDGKLLVYDVDARPGIDAPQRVWHGAEGFSQLIEALRLSYRRWVHFIGNHWVELDGDSASGEAYCMASGETYCIACHQHESPEGSNEQVNIIRYRDHYVRTALGWRFRERHAYRQWGTVRPISVERHRLDAVVRDGHA